MRGTTVGLVGRGGFGREVMPVMQDTVATVLAADTDYQPEVVFVETEPEVERVGGIRVVSEAEFLGFQGRRLFNVAIGNSVLRRTVAERMTAAGAVPLTVLALNATVLDRNDIGEGALLCAYATITSDARIGKFLQANIYSYVAHDCVLGDYVTLAPKACVNGNCHLEDEVYVGTGAILGQGRPGAPLQIGRGAVIGMGAVVTKDVPAGVTVVGNPARPLER